MDIIERLERIGRGEHLDLVDLVCAAAIEEIKKLRGALSDAIPSLERVHAMTPGGPKKSRSLAVLRRAKQLTFAQGQDQSCLSG